MKNRDERRCSILLAARTLFADRGPEAVTVAEVADQARVARATVFNHFGSKHALLEAITEDVLHGYNRLLEDALAATEVPVPGLVRSLFESMGAGIEEQRRFHRAAFREIAKLTLGPDEGGPGQIARQTALEQLVKLLARGQERGQLSLAHRPEDLAMAFDSMLFGTITHWLYDDESESLRVRMQRSAEVLLGPIVRGTVADQPGDALTPTIDATNATADPMTIDLAALEHTLQAPHRRHWPQLRRALRALQQLLDHPDQTERAFEVGYALDGDLGEKDLAVLLRCPSGRRLYYDRPCLLDALRNRERLTGMPEGSFGRAYLDHIERHGLDVAKLVELRRETDALHRDRNDAQRWLVERVDLMHDLWHVLTGYGADDFGEAALLPFSLAQRPTRSGALLSLGASVRVTQSLGLGWLVYAWRAWHRGRRAARLLALPYEELLPLPLREVRQALGIDPPEMAHPTGVLRATNADGLRSSGATDSSEVSEESVVSESSPVSKAAG